MGNDDEVKRLEQEAFVGGNTPLTSCSTVTNSSSIKVCCCVSFFLLILMRTKPYSYISACQHRSPSGQLVMAEMTRISCQSTVRVFEPLEDYRSICPQILVVCHGTHTHPIPQPLKTPPLIRVELFKLLAMLGQDLADLTSCWFLRHPTVCAYLRQRVPHISLPSPSDLHVSLSNQEHLRIYIDQAKGKAFPEGTGWEGTVYLLTRSTEYEILNFH